MSKIKLRFNKFHNNILSNFEIIDKKSRVIFLISIYLVLISIFTTIIGQMPLFSSRGATAFFQIPWALVIAPLILFDYKKAIKYLLYLLILVLPFVIYLLIAKLCGVNSISYGGTRYVFLCLYLLLIGLLFSKYINKYLVKHFCESFLLATTIFALVVFFTKLMGADISDQIYAFGDKNSAGPIFLTGAICAFYIFSKKNVLHYILRYGFFAFFSVIIALSKCRAVLICLPVIFFIMIFFDIKSYKIKLTILGVFALTVVLVVAIPQLRQVIIVDIMFNGKTDIDSIFSGRLSIIAKYMQIFKPILGSGGSYFDCMPLSLLCSYGVIGLLSVLPVLILPFVFIFKSIRYNEDKRFNQIAILLSVMFLIGCLLEGYGYIGPGTKVFFLWVFAGFAFEPFKQWLFKKYPRRYVAARTIDKLVNKIQPKTIVYIISLAGVVAAIIASCTSFYGGSIGKSIVDKMPQTFAQINYLDAEEIGIKRVVNQMCVGQKITFTVRSAKTCEEHQCAGCAFWSKGWVPDQPTEINCSTGEVFAKSTGKAFIVVNCCVKAEPGYIELPILKTEHYLFNQSYISTNKYTKSFEYTDNENIDIDINCTYQLYYDNYYVPDSVEFTYMSENPSIATVDPSTGVVKGISEGTTSIYGVVRGTNTVNKINVTVNKNDTFVPTTSIQLKNDKTCYQYEEYELDAIFNDSASDTNYELVLDGMEEGTDYTYINNKLLFNKSGDVTINVKSLNNPSVESNTINLKVVANKPVKITCDAFWLVVGEKKNAEQLGLWLHYQSGNKRILKDSDLYFESLFASHNHASRTKNGLIDNSKTTVLGVATGKLSLSFTTLIGNVSAKTTLTVSPLTYEQYLEQIEVTNTILIYLLAVLASLVFMLLKYKLAFLFASITGVYVVAIGIITMYMFKFSLTSIIGFAVFLAFIIFINIWHYAILKQKPLFVLEPNSCTVNQKKKAKTVLLVI